MPRYYCDYCDTYLTHDSPSVRKQHNAGYKHKANVRTYYQQFEEQQTQSLIDQRIREHLGQTAAFQQQVGVSFHQHLASLQSNPQRPRLPILPPPVLPNVAASQAPINSSGLPGVRPPILPRPITSAAGYGIGPSMPPMMGPPGTPSLSVQTNGLPGPPTLNPPNAVSGGLPTVSPGMYQNPAAVTSGGFDSYNISARATSPTVAGPPPAAAAAGSQDGYIFAQASEGNH